MPQLPPIDEEYVAGHIQGQLPRHRIDQQLVDIDDVAPVTPQFRVRWQPDNIVIENIIKFPNFLGKKIYDHLGPFAFVLLPGLIAAIVITIVDLSLSRPMVSDIIGLSTILVCNIIWLYAWRTRIRPQLLRLRRQQLI